ncbi:esterase [Tamilnaduibacter salinus]|uniref:Esterase n=1 Tax=Tamilnaduibacter salinus TaxID=1484056 RepID=A0A2A2I2P6_9GAMM|nr:YqiA/YcfP family alpha/beta fold hydrolase [Tamilnaduibacter salinus]PAV25862.1 esterase [Tamilnaduibacter salinus]
MTATDNRPRLIYLHGFKSSPGSEKVGELRETLERLQVPVELVVPSLGFEPERALTRACEPVEAVLGQRPCGLIGSSLGGYYATVVSARYGVPAALVNPAAYPYRLLRDYLGEQTNLHTGETFTVTEAHMQQLTDMDPGDHPDPSQLLVLLQTGDETLDYREAWRRFQGSPHWLQAGGDHRFQNFARTIPSVLAFLWPESRSGGIFQG